MRSRLLRDNLGVAAGTGLSRITGVARLGALYVAAGPALRDAYAGYRREITGAIGT